jgi:hypothetical protein
MSIERCNPICKLVKLLSGSTTTGSGPYAIALEANSNYYQNIHINLGEFMLFKYYVPVAACFL